MQTNPSAKRILLYGDSLVYGKIPGGGPRHPSNVRFSGVVQNILGEEYEIIEEGLRGRMLQGENPFAPHRNGLEQFGPIFASHNPVDLVILFLGTNDCNGGQEKNYDNIAHAFDAYQETMRWWCDHWNIGVIPQILIVCPPKMQEKYAYDLFGDMFKGADAKIQTLVKNYITYAQEHNIPYIDSSQFVQGSSSDGIHLDEESNKILAQKLAEKITELV